METTSNTIHELFVEQAKRTPGNIAIRDNDIRMTYEELDRITDAFASYLCSKGAGGEKTIAVCFERSRHLIIVLLSILKTGANYLFIEPVTPKKRISYLIDDAQPVLFVTMEEFPIDAPKLDMEEIKLSRTWYDEIPTSEPQTSHVSIPEHLAYISYTSGSTGIPKGVCVSHDAVVRLVKGWARGVAYDVFLQISSCAFDASTFEIWTPLCNGGQVAVYGAGPVVPDQVAEAIAAYKVTALWLTSGMFHLMVRDHLEAFAEVRHVIAGGDVVSSAHVERLLEKHPHLQFTNGYGPTENTTFTTCWTVDRTAYRGTVFIGQPVEGTAVKLLNDQMEEVSEGEIGELYAFGRGLARGYLNMPKETAKRFLPNPFSTVSGDRMYRTGDFAVRRSDGNLEYRGRVDQQIKIRGYRVEPAEVETAIRTQPAVEDAAVVIQKNSLGSHILLSYVIFKHDEESRVTELRDYLKQTLPYYMIPWVILPLAQLPLTPNGKVDRKGLPAIKMTPRELSYPYIEPTTELQWNLARLLSELLHKEPIGIKDDFFDLGGHSLLAAEFIQKLDHELHIKLPARDLYFGPTIEELEQAIMQIRTSDGSLEGATYV